MGGGSLTQTGLVLPRIRLVISYHGGGHKESLRRCDFTPLYNVFPRKKRIKGGIKTHGDEIGVADIPAVFLSVNVFLNYTNIKSLETSTILGSLG